MVKIRENPIWAALSEEQMSNKVGVEHQPAIKMDDLGYPYFLKTPIWGICFFFFFYFFPRGQI